MKILSGILICVGIIFIAAALTYTLKHNNSHDIYHRDVVPHTDIPVGGTDTVVIVSAHGQSSVYHSPAKYQQLFKDSIAWAPRRVVNMAEFSSLEVAKAIICSTCKWEEEPDYGGGIVISTIHNDSGFYLRSSYNNSVYLHLIAPPKTWPAFDKNMEKNHPIK